MPCSRVSGPLMAFCLPANATGSSHVSTHRSNYCTQGLQRLISSWCTHTPAAPVATSAVPEALVPMGISGLMLAEQAAHLPMLLPGRPLATQRPALGSRGENQAHDACAASPVHAHRSLTDSRGSDMCRPPARQLSADARHWFHRSTGKRRYQRIYRGGG